MGISSIESPVIERGRDHRAPWRWRPPLAGETASRFWILAILLGCGVFLRLFLLELRPFHHDEGVNGFFLTRLFREGYYHYDPENYHGPTLYFAALVFSYLLGLSSLAVRLMTASFGVAMLWLSRDLRSTIGNAGALAAVGLLALSPGSVFFSRYFIHEIMFVCFTVGLVVTILHYCETRRPTLLLVAGAWAALAFATKETAIITTGVLVIAWPCAWLHVRIHRRIFPSAKDSAAAPTAMPAREGWLDLALWTAAAFSLFILIGVVLFSSFFTYPEGVRGAVRTFEIWRKTGESSHVHAWDTYFNWLYRTEAPCLVLGAIGVIVALWRAESRKTAYLAFWAIGMLAAYSLVKYKTPWLTLNMVLPLAVMGGYAVAALLSARAVKPWLVGALVVTATESVGLLLPRASLASLASRPKVAFQALLDTAGGQLARFAEDPRFLAGMGVPLLVTAGALASALLALAWPRRPRIVIAPALILAAGVSIYQTIELNFYRYDDDRYVYVYAHTRRGFHGLVDRIHSLAEASGSGTATPISVTSTEHWPLSWYLRDYTQTGYHGAIAGLDTAAIVVGHVNQDGELRSRMGRNFTRLGAYPLRPGVDLVLFVRADIARQTGLTTP